MASVSFIKRQVTDNTENVSLVLLSFSLIYVLLQSTFYLTAWRSLTVVRVSRENSDWLLLKSGKKKKKRRKKMEPEVIQAELVLPIHFSFKRIQIYEKYPKGQPRGRWKHLKQILQAENYQNYPPDEPNYINIESPPSIHPSKKICDITGFEAPYQDPRTKLRYANADVFKVVRSLPNEHVQRYLALRNAAVVLK